MVAHRLVLMVLILIASSAGQIAGADEPAPPAISDRLLPAVLLTVSGRAALPDGSPAVGATVSAITNDGEPLIAPTRTNAAGEFQIRGVFGNGCRLHLSSGDDAFQATYIASAGTIRQASAKRLELELKSPVAHEVVVVSGDQPVKGAHAVAQGAAFRCRGVTGGDGKVALQLPAGQELQDISVWHPVLGVVGWRNPSEETPEQATRLSLQAPTPYSIRVLDSDRNAVAGLDLAVFARGENSAWFSGELFDEARVRTDADGTAVVPWVPRDGLQAVDVHLRSADWKLDKIDQDGLPQRITELEVQRRRPILGRLVLPAGGNPEGILVSGFGSGPRNNGDVPYARARRNGFFTLHLAGEHAYVLGITDVEWAGTQWGGSIPKNELAERSKIVIDVVPAIPLTVRVTRGADRTPVVGTWVHLSNDSTVEWTDEAGMSRSSTNGVQEWFKTDARGECLAGVGRGHHRLYLSSPTWHADKKFDVTSDEPVVIEFHRD